MEGLTEQQKSDYILHDCSHCPFCGSGLISPGNPAMQGDRIWVRVWCGRCGEAWDERYTLDRIREADNWTLDREGDGHD